MHDDAKALMMGVEPVAVEPTLVRPSQPGRPSLGAELQPPMVLGAYTLGRLVGRGGMAAVYTAREAGSDRVTAIKVMDPQLPGLDGSFVERFLHEARTSAALHHPNIVEVCGFGEQAGWYFLATEYVDGGTVAALLREMGTLPAALAGELLAQLLEGLVHCHRHGLIHRDLKPENLLLTRDGVLKIADFGIARSADQTKLTKTGMMVGTAGYMSPEQARGQPIDARSDLFAVGVILYELLAGVGPFHSDNPATTIMRILSNQMTPVFDVAPTALGPLEEILDRLLQPEPAARFASAQEALDAVLPLVVAQRRKRPSLLADALNRPLEVKRALDAETAAALIAECRHEPEGTDALAIARAALKLHLATRLDPANEDARARLDGLATRTTLNFGRPTNPRIAQLERQLEHGQVAPALFTQLAQLYRLEGNPLKAVGFLKSYLRVMPHDGYVAGQLAQLVGERKVAGRSGVPMGPQTRKLIAGIRTGGFNASPRPERPAASPVVSSGVELNSTQTSSALTHLARRFGPALALIVLVGLGTRWVMRKVDHLTTVSLASSQQLRNNVASSADLPADAPQVDYDKLLTTALSTAARLDQDGDREAAVAAYEQVMADFPKRPQAEQAAFRRARLLSELGRHSVAQQAFAEILARWPASQNAPEALLRLGLAAAANLRDAEAEVSLDTFLERHASHPLITEAFVARGELFARRRDFARAKADFEAALARLGPSPLRDRAQAGLERVGEPQ